MSHRPEVDRAYEDDSLRTTFFRIRALIPGKSHFIEAMFSVFPDDSAPLNYVLRLVEPFQTFRQRRPATIPATHAIVERGFFDSMRDAQQVPARVLTPTAMKITRDLSSLGKLIDRYNQRIAELDRRGGAAWTARRLRVYRSGARHLNRYWRRFNKNRIVLENASRDLTESYQVIARFLLAHPDVRDSAGVSGFVEAVRSLAETARTTQGQITSYRDHVAGLRELSAEMNTASESGVATMSGLIRVFRDLDRIVHDSVASIERGRRE